MKEMENATSSASKKASDPLEDAMLARESGILAEIVDTAVI